MVGRGACHGRMRKRRQERQDSRDQGGTTRYQMHQRMLAIGDDFNIENERGERAYKIDGKAMRLRKTISFENAAGDRLFKIQSRVLRIKDTMEIEDADGNRVALVKKALITPLRERWNVDLEHGEDLKAQGNVVDHEYAISRGGDEVATVSKRWFRVRDTYGVEIAPGEDHALLLAVAAVVDAMSHPDR